MKRLSLRITLLCVLLSITARAQHSLQLDAGSGRFGIIQGASTWPVGVSIYTLPAPGDTIVTKSTLPNLAWVLAGNALAGPSSSTPIYRLGSTNAYDVIFIANGAERLRLISGGPASFSTNAIPSSDNLYTLGTDLNRWADVYANGGSVHIGPTGGEAANTELNLGYAGNVGSINVDGGASEISVDRTANTMRFDANGDGTLEASIRTIGVGVNTGAGTDILIAQDGIQRNGGATETFSFTNSGGDIRLGIGTSSPATQLANTNLNIIDQSGDGLNPHSIAWQMSGGGFIAGFENLDAIGVNPHGLLAKVASTSANTRALVVNVGGANVFEVRGDYRVNAVGNVTLGDSPTDAHVINGAFDARDFGNIIGDLSANNQLLIEGQAGDATLASTIAGNPTHFDLAVIGDIGATGIIKSGASITIDGVSATRAITSDATMNIVTTAGDLVLNAATNSISTDDNINPSVTNTQGLGTAGLRWDVFADNLDANSITLPVGSFPDNAVFYSNNGAFAAEAAFNYDDATNILSVGPISLSGSIIPTVTNSYNLGSATNRIGHLIMAGGLDHSLNGDNPLDNDGISGHGLAANGLNYQVSSDGYAAIFSNTDAAKSDGIQIAVNTTTGTSRAITVTNGSNFNPTGGAGNRTEVFRVHDNGTTFIGNLAASTSNDVVTSNGGVLETRTLASFNLAANSEAFVTIGNSANLSGERAITAGTGVSFTDGGANGALTIDNSGVLSAIGTANQISVSGATGNVTFSLPQDIATTSTPTFGGMTINSGAGTDLTITEASLERNSAVTETINLMNAGGGMLKVGIGGAAPVSLLANTATNITDAGGDGVSNGSFSWETNSGGYVGAFYNTDAASVNPHGVLVKVTKTTANTRALQVVVNGGDVFRVQGDGQTIAWGNTTIGDNVADAHTINGSLSSAVGDVTVNDNLRIDGINGLKITEGANGTMGLATLAAGTVVVNTNRVSANSRIFLTTQNPSGAVGFVYVSARTAGTSFTITSSSATDVSDVAWVIIEP